MDGACTGGIPPGRPGRGPTGASVHVQAEHRWVRRQGQKEWKGEGSSPSARTPVVCTAADTSLHHCPSSPRLTSSKRSSGKLPLLGAAHAGHTTQHGPASWQAAVRQHLDDPPPGIQKVTMHNVGCGNAFDSPFLHSRRLLVWFQGRSCCSPHAADVRLRSPHACQVHRGPPRATPPRSIKSAKNTPHTPFWCFCDAEFLPQKGSVHLPKNGRASGLDAGP